MKWVKPSRCNVDFPTTTKKGKESPQGLLQIAHLKLPFIKRQSHLAKKLFVGPYPPPNLT